MVILKPNGHQLDVLKGIALAAMCLDHLNTVFSWESVELWMVGRMAFPVFALVWGCNLARHPASQTALNRLWQWAIAAQPVYWLALKGNGAAFFDLNILFAFAVAGQWVKGTQSPSLWPVLLAVALFLGYLPLSSLSYGLAGIVMLLASFGLFHVQTAERRWMMLALWISSVGLIYALAGLLLSGMVWFAVMLTKTVQRDRFLPRHFFTLAYVGHLAVMGGIVWSMDILS